MLAIRTFNCVINTPRLVRTVITNPSRKMSNYNFREPTNVNIGLASAAATFTVSGGISTVGLLCQREQVTKEDLDKAVKITTVAIVGVRTSWTLLAGDTSNYVGIICSFSYVTRNNILSSQMIKSYNFTI